MERGKDNNFINFMFFSPFEVVDKEYSNRTNNYSEMEACSINKSKTGLFS
jgi:hypothetical protein